MIMTVKELINKLKEYDENLEVYTRDSDTWMFQPITEVCLTSGDGDCIMLGNNNIDANTAIKNFRKNIK